MQVGPVVEAAGAVTKVMAHYITYHCRPIKYISLHLYKQLIITKSDRA